MIKDINKISIRFLNIFLQSSIKIKLRLWNNTFSHIVFLNLVVFNFDIKLWWIIHCHSSCILWITILFRQFYMFALTIRLKINLFCDLLRRDQFHHSSCWSNFWWSSQDYSTTSWMRQLRAILLCSWSNKCVKWSNTILKRRSFIQSPWSTLQFKAFKFVSITTQRWKAIFVLSSFWSIIVEASCFELFLISLLQKSIKTQDQESTSPSLWSIILD